MTNIAIIGATGMVGSTLLKVLSEKKVPFENLYLFAGAEDVGKTINFADKTYEVKELTNDVFQLLQIDYALFSAGDHVSQKYAPFAIKAGTTVIDNSNAWRMNPFVPLVVPEVNPKKTLEHQGIIANPNCSTIQSVVPINAIREKFGLKRVSYTTYQAVSGSGLQGIEDLRRTVEGKDAEFYPHAIAENCLPHIDNFVLNGYTKEEMKMINETRKIIEIKNLPVTATCVRVPIENCHSIAINIETEGPFTIKEIRELLTQTDGVKLLDDVTNNIYPLATLAKGGDDILVGRLRKDNSISNGLHLWCVADNVRKGAATNAIQILQYLLDNDE